MPIRKMCRLVEIITPRKKGAFFALEGKIFSTSCESPEVEEGNSLSASLLSVAVFIARGSMAFYSSAKMVR